ncbi:hypothetical protein WG70_05750 [Burkholderia oklahomensis EO147]|nr:hypothetical protein WG70_05750 [Burkholderia oklahomensis EO147]AOI48857.1 hypothetical protein WI23_23875 [Burkholderia oklahomensis C6786]KUY50541.1 hypothetical protein WI23_27370 [Burkholderia oklahomensis C6786]KUY51657.1 hypothetical protein WG70_15300 [Burkholderia oklahomensis EO147]
MLDRARRPADARRVAGCGARIALRRRLRNRNAGLVERRMRRIGRGDFPGGRRQSSNVRTPIEVFRCAGALRQSSHPRTTRDLGRDALRARGNRSSTSTSTRPTALSSSFAS